MCSSEELIHDARQVDLEDVIMTNETPMYLVPGKLTDAQARAFAHAHACHMGEAAALRAIAAIGTPIQQCADVETVASAYEKGWAAGKRDACNQQSRVVAEKDAEIAQLNAEAQSEIERIKREAFNRGYLIACCNISHLHNEEGIAADVLTEGDLTESDLSDLTEYDAKALSKIRSERNFDPIRAALNEGEAG